MFIKIQPLNIEELNRKRDKIGILMMIINAICVSTMTLLVKYVQHLPLMELIFFRSLPLMLIVPLVLKNRRISFIGNNNRLLFLRCLFAGCGLIAYFYSITSMTITDAITIKQLSPIFIIILASIFLGESINLQKISVFILAFFGVVLIVKPGLNFNIFPAISGMLGAIFFAGSQIALRHLRLTDHLLVIVNYFGITLGLSSFTILLFQGSFVFPDMSSLGILIALGVVGVGGQVSLTKSFQMAPANLVSLYSYLQIIFGAILGIIFFKEIPDLFSIFGASLIIISGYLYYKLNIKTN